MDSPSLPESSPSNRIKQGPESPEQMLQLPENTEISLRSADFVAIQALEMFDNTLSITSTYSVQKVPQIPMNNTCSSKSLSGRRSSSDMVKTIGNKRGCHIRKRSWTSTNVTSFIEDGHEWRKYGQKEIINAKHKRNYYRCTHKFDQGCQATKHVQKIEDESSKYMITYNRHHTCNNFLRSHQIILNSTDLKDTSILLSFQSDGLIEKEQVGSRFPSYKHEESKVDLSSFGLKDNETSSFDYTVLPHNLIMPDLSAPFSLMNSMEYGDHISTTVYSPIFEIDHILETIDYNENPFNLAHCELANLFNK